MARTQLGSLLLQRYPCPARRPRLLRRPGEPVGRVGLHLVCGHQQDGSLTGPTLFCVAQR